MTEVIRRATRGAALGCSDLVSVHSTSSRNADCAGMLSTTGESYMSHLEVHSDHCVELIIFECDGVLIDSGMIAAMPPKIA